MMTIDHILAALMLILAGVFVWKFLKSPVVEVKVKVELPVSTPTYQPLAVSFSDLYDERGELRDREMKQAVDNVAQVLQELMLDPDQITGRKGDE